MKPARIRNVAICIAVLAAFMSGDAGAITSNAGCGPDSAIYTPVEQRYSTGLIFRVEKCGAPVSYILGTVHLARPEAARAAGLAFDLVKQVDAAGFELGETEEQIAAAGFAAMTYPKNAPAHSLKRMLGSTRYAALLRLTRGTRFNAKVLEQFRPWAIAGLLEVLGEEEGTVLDEKIREAAVERHKPVFGLETPETQIYVFSSMPEPLQLSMLDDAVDHHADMMRMKEALLDAYMRRDLKAIFALGEGELASADPNLDRFLQKYLIDDRNAAMAAKLAPIVAGKSVLVAVGAMHLPGPRGLLHLLEQSGYRITPLQ